MIMLSHGTSRFGDAGGEFRGLSAAGRAKALKRAEEQHAEQLRIKAAKSKHATRSDHIAGCNASGPGKQTHIVTEKVEKGRASWGLNYFQTQSRHNFGTQNRSIKTPKRVNHSQTRLLELNQVKKLLTKPSPASLQAPLSKFTQALAGDRKFNKVTQWTQNLRWIQRIQNHERTLGRVQVSCVPVLRWNRFEQKDFAAVEMANEVEHAECDAASKLAENQLAARLAARQEKNRKRNLRKNLQRKVNQEKKR
jgi:hypothetical protein